MCVVCLTVCQSAARRSRSRTKWNEKRRRRSTWTRWWSSSKRCLLVLQGVVKGDGSIRSCQDWWRRLNSSLMIRRSFCHVNLRTFPVPFPCHPVFPKTIERGCDRFSSFISVSSDSHSPFSDCSFHSIPIQDLTWSPSFVQNGFIIQPAGWKEVCAPQKYMFMILEGLRYGIGKL